MSLHVRKEEMNKARTLSAKLEISALLRSSQYFIGKIMAGRQAPLVTRRAKSARKSAV